MQTTEPKPIAFECRFATHCEDKESGDDLHVIKEIIHYDDGTKKPNLRMKKNFKREFYLTKKGRRNFKDFKEWMKVDDLDRYECTQSKLVESIAKALGTPYFRGSLKDLCESPYIFGADITSTSIIKQTYRDKYPNTNTPYLVSAFDTETDVLHGTEEIIIAGFTCKETVFVAVKNSFVKGYAEPERLVLQACEKYLGEHLKARNAKVRVVFVDEEIDTLRKVIKVIHETSPDFVGVWNIEFDMDKIVDACKKASVSPADLLSDPSVPPQFRHFKFTKGPAKKEMASGRILNFKPSQRWHAISVPANHYWIDAMQAYRQVRMGSPERPSYSLESVLNDEIKMGKLKFKEADHLPAASLDWHKYMQKNHPIEYIVYNIFDCMGMELLDEKTLDLQLSLPMFAGTTDFAKFNSLPKKSMNELHWFCRDQGMVPGSTAKEISTDEDLEVLGNNGWITMLPSHLIADNGLKIIEENPNIRTNIRIGVAD